MFGPLLPGVIEKSVFAVRRQESGEFAALLDGETGANADMLESSSIVVKAEQEGADGGVVLLIPAKAGHHAVAIALVFDLQHGALVGLIGASDRLGHNAVETCALEAAKPIGSKVRIGRRRREMDGRKADESSFSSMRRANMEGLRAQVAIAFREQVEEDYRCGALLRKKADARSCWMEPELQFLEVESVIFDDDDLAIQHTASRQRRAQRLQ